MNGMLNISQPIIYTNTTLSLSGYLSYRNQKTGIERLGQFDAVI